MHSQSFTLCRRLSAVSLLGEGVRNRCKGSRHCHVADGVSRKTVFSHILKKCLPKKTIPVQLYAKFRIQAEARASWCSNI